MIPVVQTGDTAEDIRRLVHSVNFSGVVVPVTAVASDQAIAPSGLIAVGGVAVPRAVMRTLLPDARWLVYAAGFLNPGDGNALTVSLRYEKDDTTNVVLTSAPFSGSGFQKVILGPADVFGTAGVPPGEAVPMIRLYAQKAAGASGLLSAWTLWLRLTSSRG